MMMMMMLFGYGRVGGKFVLCTQNFVLAHTKFCVSLHKILCDYFVWILHKILCEKAMYDISRDEKRKHRHLCHSICNPCPVHMYLISESLNKVNLSVLQR